MTLDPTLANFQSQLDPERTAITASYFETDGRWVNRRIAPVFGTSKRRAALTRWVAADALPIGGQRLIRADGGTGIELPTQTSTPVEFLIKGGQLASTVKRQEIDDAEVGEKDQPYNVRAIMAAGYLNLEMELRIAKYFLPVGSSRYLSSNPNFPSANVVAASGNWATYNPVTTQVIGPDVKGIVATFALRYGVKPNFLLGDDVFDTFFMEQLMKERGTAIAIGNFRQGGDILPSCNGMIVAGMEIIIPGARSEGTPLDAVYSPERAWGTFPFAIVGYSPTLGGQEWSKVGDVYVAQADYRKPGVVPFQVNRKKEYMYEKTGLEDMWWDFERTEQVVKEDMVMAIGPIRSGS